MINGGIHTYLTILGRISISDDGQGNIDGLYLPNSNLPIRDDRENDILSEAGGQLGEYLSGKRKRFDLPIQVKGTDFQMSVWDAISGIEYGGTVTYSEIAGTIGKRSSYRAVGTACGSNPIPIIIPCHRVVRSSGDIGGYVGGSSMKKTLLSLEMENL